MIWTFIIYFINSQVWNDKHFMPGNDYDKCIPQTNPFNVGKRIGEELKKNNKVQYHVNFETLEIKHYSAIAYFIENWNNKPLRCI